MILLSVIVYIPGHFTLDERNFSDFYSEHLDLFDVDENVTIQFISSKIIPDFSKKRKKKIKCTMVHLIAHAQLSTSYSKLFEKFIFGTVTDDDVRSLVEDEEFILETTGLFCEHNCDQEHKSLFLNYSSTYANISSKRMESFFRSYDCEPDF